MVNQYKSDPSLLSLFSNTDVRICTIYPACLDFGFDLTKCDENWIREEGDSIIVTLPPVEILNKDMESLDEANKRVPIESGEWTPEEKIDFRERAEAIMLRNCEKEQCYKMAEKQGQKTISKLFEAFGKKNVKVVITPREQYGFGDWKKTEKDDFSFYFFKNDNVTWLSYSNKSRLYYNINDLTYSQLLTFADLYKVISPNYTRASLVAKKDGLHIQLYNVELEKGTQTTKKGIEQLKRDKNAQNFASITQEIFKDKKTFCDIMDKNGAYLTSITAKE